MILASIFLDQNETPDLISYDVEFTTKNKEVIK
jgi:hypothetical protein